MAERAGRSERLRAAAPVRVGSATLLVVERVALALDRGAAGGLVVAGVEPFALVVRDRGATRAVGIGAGALTLEGLRERIPDLDRLLDGA